jgi:hypothetical protein
MIERCFDMMTMGRGVALLAAMTLGVAVRAADATGGTARVRLIAGLDAEKAYLPRLREIRALEKGPTKMPNVEHRTANAGYG